MASFSDDFSGTLASWSLEAGTPSISSGVLTALGGYDPQLAIHSTSCDGVEQYICFSYSTPNDSPFSGPILRYSNSSSSFYRISINYYGDVSAFKCSISSFESGGLSGGEDVGGPFSSTKFGVTISGTTTTTIRIWVSVTSDTPVSATEWDSGDTTPNVTFSDSSSPITTGNLVGLSFYQGTAGHSTFDNFYGGDIPTVSSGNPWYYYAQQMRQKLEEKLKRRILIPGFAGCMRYGFAR